MSDSKHSTLQWYYLECVQEHRLSLVILPTTEGLQETTGQLQLVVPKFATLITDRVSRQCIHCLESAQTIPRLFRRTNREVRNGEKKFPD